MNALCESPNRRFGLVRLLPLAAAVLLPSTGVAAPKAVDGKTKLDSFAGKLWTKKRAKAIAASRGWTYVDHWGCPDGSDRCAGLWVQTPKGPFQYILSTKPCTRKKADPNRRFCVGGYLATTRHRLKDELVVTASGFLWERNRVLQGAIGGRWRKLVTIQSTVMHKDEGSAGWTDHHDHLITARDGTVLSQDSETVQAIPSSPSGGATVGELCGALRDTIEASSRIGTAGVDLACDSVVPDSVTGEMVLEPTGVGVGGDATNDLYVCENIEKGLEASADLIAAATYLDCLKNPSSYFPDQFKGSGTPPDLSDLDGTLSPANKGSNQTVSKCEDYKGQAEATWEENGVTVTCWGEVEYDCAVTDGVCECNPADVGDLVCTSEL